LADDDGRVPILFSALSDSRRFGMFRLLVDREDICVSEMADIFGISVPAASQQLRILEMTGLIRRERRGKNTCYAANCEDPVVKSLLGTCCWQGRNKKEQKT